MKAQMHAEHANGSVMRAAPDRNSENAGTYPTLGKEFASHETVIHV